MPTKKFSLPKSKRLKGRQRIEQMFQCGSSIFSHPIALMYQYENLEPGQEWIAIGVGVSKKNIKLAVDRNKIKRMMREIIRLNQDILVQKAQASDRKLNIMLVYVGKLIPEWDYLERIIKNLSAKIA